MKDYNDEQIQNMLDSASEESLNSMHVSSEEITAYKALYAELNKQTRVGVPLDFKRQIIAELTRRKGAFENRILLFVMTVITFISLGALILLEVNRNFQHMNLTHLGRFKYIVLFMMVMFAVIEYSDFSFLKNRFGKYQADR